MPLSSASNVTPRFVVNCCFRYSCPLMRPALYRKVRAELQGARSGEIRLAAWDEMDTTDHVWAIPATRMKMKRDHRVPLCRRAMEVLDAARTLGDGPLVFPAGAAGGWTSCGFAGC